MTVYIEYVLIDNFIIDYLMLKASFALTATSVSRARLFFCAVLGAIFALFYPLISVHTVILTAIKICFGLLMVILAGKFKSKKAFYTTTIVFFCYTFLTGGAVIGIFNLLNLPYSSEISIAIMVIPVYFVFRGISAVVKFLYRQKNINCYIYKVEITAFGITKTGKGFFDTGNELYDGDKPVIVCEKRFAQEFLAGSLASIKLKKLLVSTINGQEENIAFNIEQIKIYNSDEPNIFNNITLCVSKKSVGRNYDVILNTALKGEKYNEQAVIKTKKIS